MTSIEIIVSTSMFTTDTIFGVAFKGDSNPLNVEKWAESHGQGRPATSQTLNVRPEADQLNYLIGRWQEWSERTGIPLTINPTPRKVRAPF